MPRKEEDYRRAIYCYSPLKGGKASVVVNSSDMPQEEADVMSTIMYDERGKLNDASI